MKKLLNKKSLFVNIFGLLLCSTNLSASVEIISPTIKSDIRIMDLKNDEMKILIDCSFEKSSWLSGRKYSEDESINDFKSLFCSKVKSNNQTQEINFGELQDAINKLGLRTSSAFIKTSYSALLEQNPKFVLNLDFGNNYTSIKSNRVSLNVPVIYLKNAVINTNVNYEHTKIKFEDTNIIKDYKYDYKNQNVQTYVLDKPISSYTAKTFTNNYNIDDATECINGYVWVKKYGNKTGEYCSLIEK